MARQKRESSAITKSLADRLTDLMADERERLGESQNEICKKMCVPSSSYSEWAADSKTPSLELLVKVANYFDCSVDYLLGATDIRSRDVNVAVACENTGLSEDALFRLQCLKDEPNAEHLFIANALIASEWMDGTIRYIGEIREAQRDTATDAESEELQDEAIARAKKVLGDAGIKEYKILSRDHFWNHQRRTLVDCFDLMLQIDLFNEQGELYAGK